MSKLYFFLVLAGIAVACGKATLNIPLTEPQETLADAAQSENQADSASANAGGSTAAASPAASPNDSQTNPGADAGTNPTTDGTPAAGTTVEAAPVQQPGSEVGKPVPVSPGGWGNTSPLVSSPGAEKLAITPATFTTAPGSPSPVMNAVFADGTKLYYLDLSGQVNEIAPNGNSSSLFSIQKVCKYPDRVLPNLELHANRVFTSAAYIWRPNSSEGYKVQKVGDGTGSCPKVFSNPAFASSFKLIVDDQGQLMLVQPKKVFVSSASVSSWTEFSASSEVTFSGAVEMANFAESALLYSYLFNTAETQFWELKQRSNLVALGKLPGPTPSGAKPFLSIGLANSAANLFLISNRGLSSSDGGKTWIANNVFQGHLGYSSNSSIVRIKQLPQNSSIELEKINVTEERATSESTFSFSSPVQNGFNSSLQAAARDGLIFGLVGATLSVQVAGQAQFKFISDPGLALPLMGSNLETGADGRVWALTGQDQKICVAPADSKKMATLKDVPLISRAQLYAHPSDPERFVVYPYATVGSAYVSNHLISSDAFSSFEVRNDQFFYASTAALVTDPLRQAFYAALGINTTQSNGSWTQKVEKYSKTIDFFANSQRIKSGPAGTAQMRIAFADPTDSAGERIIFAAAGKPGEIVMNLKVYDPQSDSIQSIQESLNFNPTHVIPWRKDGQNWQYSAVSATGSVRSTQNFRVYGELMPEPFMIACPTRELALDPRRPEILVSFCSKAMVRTAEIGISKNFGKTWKKFTVGDNLSPVLDAALSGSKLWILTTDGVQVAELP